MWVVVGRIGAPYGIHGWHHINSFTKPLNNILQYSQWYIEQKGNWVPYKVEMGRSHGKGLVAHLQGIDNPESASLLTQCKIAVKREQLAPCAEDEFYWADLEGLLVQTIQGETLGPILYLYENTGLDVMVVKTPEREVHIPFLMHDTVKSVDLDRKIVVVDWEQ